MNWRRCCIDVDMDGRVMGASIEFYNDMKLKPNVVAVLARSEWNGCVPARVLEEELHYDWPDGQGGFVFIGAPD